MEKCNSLPHSHIQLIACRYMYIIFIDRTALVKQGDNGFLSIRLYSPGSTVWPMTLIPSRISGRGYKISPVCLSVRPSVIQRSFGWTVWNTDPKIGRDIDLDDISDEFEGQGHRSKVKITRLKNMILQSCRWACTDVQCHQTVKYYKGVMSQRDIIKIGPVCLASAHNQMSFDQPSKHMPVSHNEQLYLPHTRKMTVRRTLSLE